ncbi:21537_t:CDS:2, partial [Gigaspora rosea]
FGNPENRGPEILDKVWSEALGIVEIRQGTFVNNITRSKNCPYPQYFTRRIIVDTNSYKKSESIMTTSTSSALHGASKVNGTLKFKKIVLSDDGVNEKYIPSLEPSEKTAAAKSGANHVLIYDSFMYLDEISLSKLSSRIFNELRDNVPIIAPKTTSEQEHYFQFLFLLIFLNRNNEYDVRLDRSVKDTRQSEVAQSFVVDLRFEGIGPFLRPIKTSLTTCEKLQDPRKMLAHKAHYI